MDLYDWRRWIPISIERYPEVKFALEEAVESLLKQYFSRSDDYTVEKFCKSFCETIRNLQGLLEERRGLSKIYRGLVYQPEDLQKALEDIEEIKLILKREIERLKYNYNEFLFRAILENRKRFNS